MTRRNRRSRAGTWLATAALALLMSGCATSPAPEPAQAPAGTDGLEYRGTKGLDMVYVRPGVDFASYRSILIDPVQVAFDKDWDPNRTRLTQQFSPADLQAIKDDMAQEFRRIFVEELAAGGYRVVEQAGNDTLRVTPALADVYINAPDAMAAGRSRSYTMEAGEMTLVLEARDGPTGQLLARVVDRKAGMDSGVLTVTNSVTNAAEFRRAVRAWAQRLRTGLDRLNGKTA